MAKDLPSQRFVLLINQMGEALGKPRGWYGTVAERLGVDRSFVWRIANGKRTAISGKTIADARAKMSLSEDFFTKEYPHVPWFETFIETPGMRRLEYPVGPDWQVLHETLLKAGMKLSRGEQSFREAQPQYEAALRALLESPLMVEGHKLLKMPMDTPEERARYAGAAVTFNMMLNLLAGEIATAWAAMTAIYKDDD